MFCMSWYYRQKPITYIMNILTAVCDVVFMSLCDCQADNTTGIGNKLWYTISAEALTSETPWTVGNFAKQPIYSCYDVDWFSAYHFDENRLRLTPADTLWTFFVMANTLQILYKSTLQKSYSNCVLSFRWRKWEGTPGEIQCWEILGTSW